MIITYASVFVDDQQKALEFYTDKLGCAVATDQPMGPGARWIELRIPGAETRLVLWKPQPDQVQPGGFMNLAFVADDVAQTYEDLSARGVEFVQPARTEAWGTSAIFADPDGNRFVISSR